MAHAAGAIRLLLLCAVFLGLAIQARRRRWNLAGAVLMFTLLIAIAACGGGRRKHRAHQPGDARGHEPDCHRDGNQRHDHAPFTFTINVN